MKILIILNIFMQNNFEFERFLFNLETQFKMLAEKCNFIFKCGLFDHILNPNE